MYVAKLFPLLSLSYVAPYHPAPYAPPKPVYHPEPHYVSLLIDILYTRRNDTFHYAY